ncbi:MAG: YihY/virulence factor BrkB family protein [Anaerolineae bacterium]|nr:YihY/virulence factor BrkB family protein [Anaerolineae bacterium]
MRFLRRFGTLLKESLDQWNADRMATISAALAYYAIFSLAPLLIIAIAIAGAVLGRQTVRAEVLTQLADAVGSEGAEAIATLIDNTTRPGAGLLATVIGVAALALGAAGIFNQLRQAFIIIWDIVPDPNLSGLQAFLRTVRDQFLSVLMVLVTGVLLLGSLVLSAVLSGIIGFLSGQIAELASVWQTVNVVATVAALTLIFGAVYRYFPGLRLTWLDVLPAALLAATLFTIGRSLIGLYLGQSTIGSTYGAAGSLIAVLVWIYYSAQIFFFGAEFSRVYTERYGSRAKAHKTARVDVDEN